MIKFFTITWLMLYAFFVKGSLSFDQKKRKMLWKEEHTAFCTVCRKNNKRHVILGHYWAKLRVSVIKQASIRDNTRLPGPVRIVYGLRAVNKMKDYSLWSEQLPYLCELHNIAYYQ